MILIDVNILVYATFKNFAQHQAVQEWLEDQFNTAARIGLPWPSLLGFLRIATNLRAFPHAMATESAWRHIEEWLAHEPVWIPQPTERHPEILGSLLQQPGVRGNLVPDAHLAALAIEHGLTLCSIDGDFGRFRNLKWLNPLST